MAPKGDIGSCARNGAENYPSRQEIMIHYEATANPPRNSETKLGETSAERSIPNVSAVTHCPQERHKNTTKPMQRRRRKQFVLPTKRQKEQLIEDTTKRGQQKQALSLRTFFESRDQELLFRYGPTYRKFVGGSSQPKKRAKPNVGTGRVPSAARATSQQIQPFPKKQQNPPEEIREVLLEPRPKWMRSLLKK